jgi:hypothetical protein
LSYQGFQERKHEKKAGVNAGGKRKGAEKGQEENAGKTPSFLIPSPCLSGNNLFS